MYFNESKHRHTGKLRKSVDTYHSHSESTYYENWWHRHRLIIGSNDLSLIASMSILLISAIKGLSSFLDSSVFNVWTQRKREFGEHKKTSTTQMLPRTHLRSKDDAAKTDEMLDSCWDHVNMWCCWCPWMPERDDSCRKPHTPQVKDVTLLLAGLAVRVNTIR